MQVCLRGRLFCSGTSGWLKPTVSSRDENPHVVAEDYEVMNSIYKLLSAQGNGRVRVQGVERLPSRPAGHHRNVLQLQLFARTEVFADKVII